MASSKDIPQRKTSRRDPALSFTAGSPTAQEIVARDLADCEGIQALDGAVNDDSESEAASGTGPVLYKQPSGVAYGSQRPSMVTEPVDEPRLTRVEKEQSRSAERSLLRDNHLIPPKADCPEEPGLFARICRRAPGFGAGARRLPDEEHGRAADGQASESSPLLAGADRPRTPDSEHLDVQWDAAVATGDIETSWRREAKTIATYSRSLILTFLLQYSINITSVFFVGHIGKIELGAVSLASMTANICCFAPMQGLATCLDTLCAQAYGSGHKQLVGLQVQRMTYFLWLLMIPIAVLFFFAEDVLRLIVTEPRTAELAGLYLRIMVVGIPGFAAFEGGKRFVQSQGLFVATTYVLLAAAPLNVFLNWLLVWHLGWGFVGAPIAVAFTESLMPVLLLLYVFFVNGSQCWGGFTKRAFSNWGPMIWLALPGMVMVVAEWLAFEILTLASSRLGTSYLAAQSILVTLTSTTFMIPFPVSVAASTRIATLIGAKLVNAAKTSARVAIFAGCLIGLFNLVLLSSLRYQLPRLFTQDEEVILIVAKVMPLCSVMQVFDGMAAVAHGLLRGIGKQSFGGYANLITYYLIAIPVSFATAFALDWKLTGLWLGTTIGLILVGSAEYLYAYMSDWDQSVREAEHRNTAG
ncbi:multidrug and toxin extrusion protein [Xylariaceae sp. FL0804]|nr:multidrug and toxin extrusion protein [Xylariaceae sp. FL0804]